MKILFLFYTRDYKYYYLFAHNCKVLDSNLTQDVQPNNIIIC